MLTDEQIDRLCDECGAVVWEGSATEQAIRAAYRLGMLRAAEVCEGQASEPECPERAQYCAEAIRAEAVETSEPRKGE